MTLPHFIIRRPALNSNTEDSDGSEDNGEDGEDEGAEYEPDSLSTMKNLTPSTRTNCVQNCGSDQTGKCLLLDSASEDEGEWQEDYEDNSDYLVSSQTVRTVTMEWFWGALTHLQFGVEEFGPLNNIWMALHRYTEKDPYGIPVYDACWEIFERVCV